MVDSADLKQGLSRIAIEDGYEFRYFFLAMSKKIINKFQSYVCVYVHSVSAELELLPFVDEGIISEVKLIPSWKGLSVKKYSEIESNEIMSIAKNKEHELGINYNSIRIVRRDLGLDYYPGAENHPQSYISKHSNRIGILKALNTHLQYWEDELTNNKISLVINGLREVCHVANKLNIQIRHLTNARYDNRYYWTSSLYFEQEMLKSEYDKLPLSIIQELVVNSYYLDKEHRNLFFSKNLLLDFIQSIWHSMKSELYRCYKKRSKGYLLLSTVKFLYFRYMHCKQLFAGTMPDISDIPDNTKVVYFPLQTEPEQSLHWMSPEYTYQLSAILSISRDLPADAVLVVKEHIYAIGKRSRNFYSTIKQLKNVVFVNVKTPSIDIIHRSRLVVTISGTVGREAACLGKPVIMFGKHNEYGFLDYVYQVDCEQKLPLYIKEALSDNFDNIKSKNIGMRLQQAIVNSSFSLGNFINLKRKNVPDEAIEEAILHLKKSISTNDIKKNDNIGKELIND